MFDLSKTKVGDLSESELGELKKQLLNSSAKEVAKFLSRVLDDEYKLGGKSESNKRVENFLSDKDFTPYRNQMYQRN